MFKCYLILSCLCFSSLSFADNETPKEVQTLTAPSNDLELGDEHFANGSIAEALEHYNKVLSDKKCAKRSKAKAMIRKCFLDYACNNTDEALNSYKSLFGERKIRRFMRKAKKYSRMLEGAGEKQAVKQLIFEMTSTYLDELLGSLFDEDSINPA